MWAIFLPQCTPFYYITVEYKGYTFHGHVFLMYTFLFALAQCDILLTTLLALLAALVAAFLAMFTPF